MADIGKLKTLTDIYGIGVRSGLVTPQIDDEVYFRKLAELPEMSEDVVEDWAKTDNVRKPVTLANAQLTSEVNVDEDAPTPSKN